MRNLIFAAAVGACVALSACGSWNPPTSAAGTVKAPSSPSVASQRVLTWSTRIALAPAAETIYYTINPGKLCGFQGATGWYKGQHYRCNVRWIKF